VRVGSSVSVAVSAKVRVTVGDFSTFTIARFVDTAEV